MGFRAKVKKLKGRVGKLTADNTRLRQENKDLRSEVMRYRHMTVGRTELMDWGEDQDEQNERNQVVSVTSKTA